MPKNTVSRRAGAPKKNTQTQRIDRDRTPAEKARLTFLLAESMKIEREIKDLCTPGKKVRRG